MRRTSDRSSHLASRRKSMRWGTRVESLESRRMMFGDGVLVADAIVDLPSIDLTPPGLVARADTCIDFEDLGPAASYGVGGFFIADNSGLQAKFTGQPFTWSGGGVTVGGSASVAHSQLAGHLGQDLAVNNILLDVDFNGIVSGLRMNFGEYGGNLNLEVNGDFRNFEDFQDLHGLAVGGTLIQVVAGGFGDDQGTLEVQGPIHSFKVGGQELWIDHLCIRELENFEFDWGDAPDQPYRTLAAAQWSQASGGSEGPPGSTRRCGGRRATHFGRGWR